MAHSKRLNTFHLFAGAGGGILADLLLGHNPIGACEIEPYPRNVLLARQADGILPNFPIWDDVATLDGNPWRGSVDVLCGGFPCQDISSAGKGAGISGERSGLWKEYARLIGEMRPRFVFAENSPLLRTRGLGVVLKDLASLGYNARWGVLGARDVGAPHKRDRMWVLAYPRLHGHSTTKKSESTTSGGNSGTSEQEQTVEPSGLCSPRADEAVGHPMHTRLQGDKFPRWTNSQRREEPNGSTAKSSGLWWENDPAEGTFEPVVGRVAHGVANRVDRLKAIGNGQVPQCAAMAFNILSEGLI
jgi:DNA (cytosine-5)-methyltransferase 1